VIVACSSCAQKNRVPFARLGETGQCGRCQAALSPPATPLDVASEAGLAALIAGSPLPVVVDFWAPWCGPCRSVAPEIEKVARANAGRFVVVKVNTEALPQLGARHQVQGIPLLAVFHNKREVARSAGARPAPAIEAWIRQALTGAA
jgi:thioredoxin 2